MQQGKTLTMKPTTEPSTVTSASFEDLVREMLVRLGEDPNREGLTRTPERVHKALQFLTKGYSEDPETLLTGALFTVALGLGTTPKVALAAVLVFFVVFFNAFQGVREVDRNLLANARVLGASRLAVTRHVVLPSALTWIIASLHVAFGLAIIGAIVGEFLGAQKGLGLLIATSQNNFNPDGVFGAMFIIAVLALTAEGLIGLLERRLLSWRPPSQSEAGVA